MCGSGLGAFLSLSLSHFVYVALYSCVRVGVDVRACAFGAASRCTCVSASGPIALAEMKLVIRDGMF